MNGGAATGKQRINWLVYLLQDEAGAITLIDSGFTDAALRSRFGLTNFKAVKQILEASGFSISSVKKIILTHTHFDHAQGIDTFPQAMVYLHESEFARPIDPTVAQSLRRRKELGLVTLVSDKHLVAGGLVAGHAGGHTPGSLVVRFEGRKKLGIFTGDECYTADACRRHKPLPGAAAHSPAASLRFVQSIDAQAIIYAGHEPNLVGGRWLNDNLYYFDVM